MIWIIILVALGVVLWGSFFRKFFGASITGTNVNAIVPALTTFGCWLVFTLLIVELLSIGFWDLLKIPLYWIGIGAIATIISINYFFLKKALWNVVRVFLIIAVIVIGVVMVARVRWPNVSVKTVLTQGTATPAPVCRTLSLKAGEWTDTGVIPDPKMIIEVETEKIPKEIQFKGRLGNGRIIEAIRLENSKTDCHKEAIRFHFRAGNPMHASCKIYTSQDCEVIVWKIFG